MAGIGAIRCFDAFMRQGGIFGACGSFAKMFAIRHGLVKHIQIGDGFGDFGIGGKPYIRIFGCQFGHSHSAFGQIFDIFRIKLTC